ncbi:MAG TPA: beta/gamma crystallin-related protein [Phenylobacterium sp.]|nr:beta/gamma crystallin-related protein [Phenylobacterium sp.]
MRIILSLSALALAAAAPALAQPNVYGAPRGSYERLCTDIRVEGQFLSAWCRGSRGSAQSTINILSCSTDISVDADGGLTCIGPGGGQPPSVRDAPPGYATPSAPGYGSGGYYGDRRGYRRDAADLYSNRGWRGRSFQVRGDMPNLEYTGLNDRIRSIRLRSGSGPWIVCTDANYGGRCVTVSRSVYDTQVLGMRDSISSMRPAR